MVKGRALRDKVKIGARLVGAGEPCFIIAEAGVNHNGKVALARKLIDVAAAAGADAVKFQTFRAEDVITAGAAKARYQQEATGAYESQLAMIKKLELGKADFKKLFDYASKQGIIFLSTPFDKGSVDLLDELGVPAFKIASGEITNFPLLKIIAAKGKPIILSTGMSSMGEIRDALDVLKDGGGRGDYPAALRLLLPGQDRRYESQGYGDPEAHLQTARGPVRPLSGCDGTGSGRRPGRLCHRKTFHAG